ncbi:MAG: DUF1549 domain-containing protein, partial [Verrucomicrobia bacterium]|nr:DUF1549 domain-containing protein [Verrucomicrobiota bacterium]
MICVVFQGALPAYAATAPSYNLEIRPILSQNCFYCHGPDEESRKAHLRLDSYEGATSVHKDRQAINPEQLSASQLIARITSTDPDVQMPPPDSNKHLSPEQIAKLTQWVKSGAQYAGHWSFTAPQKAALPEAASAPPGWTRNAIDTFIFARLQQAELAPMPEADKRRLLRRVTFDLTGLPPSLGALDAYLADDSSNTYEKVVDRLLASEQYGERMALAWMDAARYGDSSVMHADGPRTMWPWRDWVINAYNSNMPYDQFTVEQLGGDLIADAREAQKIATGFNRNNASSDEGGAFPEELRVEYVVDRVKTTANVFLGLSMECAQCHDHKYDPISNRDYYQFFAYFNNNADPGMQSRNGNEKPVVQLQDSVSARKRADIERERADIEQKRSARREDAASEIAGWIAAQQATFDAGDLELRAPIGLRHHFPLDEEAGSPFRDEASVDIGHLEGTYTPATRDGVRSGLYVDGKTTVAFKDVGSFAEFDAPLTMAAWIKSRDNTTGSIVARMDEPNKHRGFDLILTEGSVGTHLIHAWPNNAIKVWSEAKIKNDVWQHVAVTYDGSLKA